MLEGSEQLNKSLDQYVSMMVRQRWWLLLPTCLVALGTLGVSLLLPDLYRSETVLLVEHQRVPEHYVVANVSTEFRERLQTITQQILSRTRLLGIIDEFGLYADKKKNLVPEELVELMRSNINIELVEGERRDPRRDELNAFKLSFAAESPRVAQQVASRLTSLFIEENLKAREQQSLGTTNFLQAQLEVARQDLQEQEKRLSEFKTRYLGELPEQQAGNLTVLAGLQMRLQNNATSLNRAREQRVFLVTMLQQYESLAEAGGTLPGSPLESPTAIAARELARVRTQRAALLARYTREHPDIAKIDEEIAQAEALQVQLSKEQKERKDQETEAAGPTPGTTTTATAIANLNSQLEANQAEVDNLIREEKRLQQEIAEYQRRLHITPVREEQLTDLIRDYNLSKRNYEDLLRKKLESELATNLEKRQQGEQFRVLDPPSLPSKPFSPNRMRISLVGLVAGLGVAMAMAFLSAVRDSSFHTEQDVSQLFSLSLVLGVPELLTASEQRRRWWKRCGEWVAGCLLVLAVIGGELLIYWRG